jgi:hypothetical protein
MKITRRQLRQIIKESIDVINDENGELIEFGDMEDAAAPEAALDNILQRLGIKPKRQEIRGLEAGGVETDWYFNAEDYADIYHETEGKRHVRGRKKERTRMDIGNLLAKATEWAVEAGREYSADNITDVDMELVARDLALGAKYEFAADEWEELIYHFDDEGQGLDHLIDFIADSIVGQG